MLLFSQLVKAQFIDDNMHWTEIETNIFDPNIKTISEYRTAGDTTINGLTYWKVYNDDNFVNQTVTTNKTVISCNIINVHDVKVQNGAKLILNAANEVNITSNFEVISGSECEINN